jgi:hypothetical protein
MCIQRKQLNVITLGQRESDNINRMITISNRLLKQKAFLLFIWDLLNLGQFDHINRTITISVITLSDLHCTSRGKLSNRPLFTGGCCSEVVVKAGLTVNIFKLVFKVYKHLLLFQQKQLQSGLVLFGGFHSRTKDLQSLPI